MYCTFLIHCIILVNVVNFFFFYPAFALIALSLLILRPVFLYLGILLPLRTTDDPITVQKVIRMEKSIVKGTFVSDVFLVRDADSLCNSTSVWKVQIQCQSVVRLVVFGFVLVTALLHGTCDRLYLRTSNVVHLASFSVLPSCFFVTFFPRCDLCSVLLVTKVCVSPIKVEPSLDSTFSF